MKKTIMTIAIVLGLGMTAFAGPNGGGLFNRGDDAVTEGNRTNTEPLLPFHNLSTHQDATPVGSGIILLSVLGGAYLVGKKRREE